MSSETRQFPSLHSAIHSVRYPLKSIFFMAIYQLLGTTESACFLLTSTEMDFLFLLRAENFPHICRKLPSQLIGANWIMCPFLNQSLLTGKYLVLIGLGPDY